MSPAEQINDAMLTELNRLGLKTDTSTRLLFLRGMRDSWREDKDNSPEKAVYMDAIDREIDKLRHPSSRNKHQ